MGLFDKLFKKEEEVVLPELNVGDDDIVALADGELIDIKTVSDPVFAEQMMGKSTAFKFPGDKVVLCAPANGTLAVLFPTGHAYGLMMNNGVELLVHCGVDTVNANGDGFRLLGKKQGDTVKAGDPIVEVDLKKLSKTYDMSTMLIITNANDKELDFVDPKPVTRGEKVTK
ncbi:MAG: PTS glucose transporter subunit IIA [Erysipelotrichaceae bacterium]|nr:PTS glucose transporter subunit IIA [Erysipelotrichaceae bacterium]